MAVETMALVGGRYLLQKPVVVGGPVELYIALDRQLQRSVAVEILSLTASEDKALRDRFHRHQTSVSAIHHPGILEVYDAGQWNGRPYLVMEREAAQLHSSASGTVSTSDPSVAISMTRQAADALHFCRQAGLASWPFSYEAVRTGPSGNAHLALLEDSLLGKAGGRFTSRRDVDDPSALSALLRLLLSGTPQVKDMQPYISTLPASVGEALRRIESGSQDSFANAGEVAGAVKEIEATSNDYTQANVPATPAERGAAFVPVPPPPDLQRTSSLAEAPTLAIGQQSMAPPLPYQPAEDIAVASTLAVPAAPGPRIPVPNPMGYVPGVEPAAPVRRRRPALLILLPLLGLAILLAGAYFLFAQQRMPSPIISSNLAALPNSAAAATPAIAALPTSVPATSAPVISTPPVLPTVPALLGNSLEEATAAVESLGFSLSVGDPVESSDIPRDRVASQEPPPGAELQPGTSIMVALSLGPAPKEEKDEDGGDGATPLTVPPAPEVVQSQPEQKQSPGKKEKEQNKGKKK